MASHPFEAALANLDAHYSRLLDKHGDSPQGVQWRDRASQELRMQTLVQIGDLHEAKILDFGCGTGHLLDFLRQHLGFTGEYVGLDLSADMIQAAQKRFPDIRFEHRDILADGMPESFDYMILNGVFNNRIDDNWGLMTAVLRTLMPRIQKGMAFNAISTYVDYMEPELYYVDPEKVFAFCKEHLSPCVTLRHDYTIKPGVVPYEFTVYVYASDIEPRKTLQNRAERT